MQACVGPLFRTLLESGHPASLAMHPHPGPHHIAVDVSAERTRSETLGINPEGQTRTRDLQQISFFVYKKKLDLGLHKPSRPLYRWQHFFHLRADGPGKFLSETD